MKKTNARLAFNIVRLLLLVFLLVGNVPCPDFPRREKWRL
jgi:hypothetical protein